MPKKKYPSRDTRIRIAYWLSEGWSVPFVASLFGTSVNVVHRTRKAYLNTRGPGSLDYQPRRRKLTAKADPTVNWPEIANSCKGNPYSA